MQSGTTHDCEQTRIMRAPCSTGIRCMHMISIANLNIVPPLSHDNRNAYSNSAADVFPVFSP